MRTAMATDNRSRIASTSPLNHAIMGRCRLGLSVTVSVVAGGSSGAGVATVSSGIAVGAGATVTASGDGIAALRAGFKTRGCVA